jgi:selenocysteine-specific elongation factor
MELLAGAAPLRHGARVHVHHGTADLEGRVAVCAARPATGAWTQAAVGDRAVTVPPGGQAYVRLRFRTPLAIARHDRIVLRAYSPADTIGGGFVLDPSPPASGLRRAGTLARFESIDLPASGAPDDADRRTLQSWLREAAERGMDAVQTAARGGLDIATAAGYLGELTKRGEAIAAGDRTFDGAVVRTMEGQIVQEIAARHKADPLDPGMPRDAMRGKVAGAAEPGLFDAVLDRLTRAGTIAGTDRLSLTTHRGTKTPAEARATEAVDAAMKAAGLTPPDAAGLADAARLTSSDVQRAIQLLTREGRLMRLGDLLFHTEALRTFKAEVQRLGAGRAAGAAPVQLDIGAVKERFGLSRKYAIPLLEWLDRERVTRRVGTTRVIL